MGEMVVRGGESDDVGVGSLGGEGFPREIVMGGGGNPKPLLVAAAARNEFCPIDSSSLQNFSHPSTMVKSYL